MRRRLIIVSFILFSCAPLKAQTIARDFKTWADGWKYAFSQEGRRDWMPEFTGRWTTGFFTTGPEFTGGVRIDDRRTFGLLVGRGELYLDAYPASVYSISTGAFMRRYFHVGKRDILAFYNDAAIGARWVYRVDGKYRIDAETGERTELVGYNPGDVWFFAAWEPGIRIRCWRSLHVFLGPTVATDCIGFHIGLGL